MRTRLEAINNVRQFASALKGAREHAVMHDEEGMTIGFTCANIFELLGDINIVCSAAEQTNDETNPL